MTSASNSGNFVDFDEYIGLKLEKTRSTIRSTDVLTALAGIAAVFLSYLLVFVIFDQWVFADGFSALWRWLLLSTLVLSTAAWVFWKVALPSIRSVNGLFAAREIEKAEPGLKSNLLNLVDLKAAGRTVNPTILKALERQAALKLQKVDVGQSIDHRPLIRTAYALLVIIVVFCFYAMLSPKKISNSIWRGLMPGSQVGVATITEIIDVKPGDKTIPAHEQSVDIQVDIAGEIPPHVTLLYTTSDGKQDQPVELHVEQAGQTRYHGQLIGEGTQGLIHDITYYIRAGDATSRQFKITVEQPPYADVEMVRIEHPGYMKIPPYDQPNNPGIDAWEGAKVILSAKANMPLRSAKIQFLDDAQSGPNGEEELMSISGGGRQLQAAWMLRRNTDGTQPKLYRIDCRTEDDRVTLGHVNYPINIKPDLPPEVVMVYPDRDLSVAANATIPLAIQARDPDFELSYIYLNVEKSGQKIFREQLSEGRQSKLTVKSELPMTRLNPAVGDTFEIWVEAFDNKQPTPNSRATPKVKIRILPPMTPKEADRELAEQKNQAEDKIAEADKNLNEEQREAAQQPDDGEQKREKPDEVAAKDNDQQRKADPQEQNQNDQQDQQDQNQQNADQQQAGKGKSGVAKPGEKSNAKEERGQGKDGESNQKGNSSAKQGDEKQSLKTDGSQDDEAMRRINQSLNEKKSSKPRDSNESDNPEQKSSDQNGEQKKPGSDPNQAGKDEQKPSEDQAGDQNKSNERKAAGDRNKQEEKGAGNQQKSNPSNDDQQSQQPSDASKNQSDAANESDSATENQPNKKSADSQKGTKQQKQSDTDDNEKSKDESAADGKDGQQQDSARDKDETKQDSKSDPKPNQKGAGKDGAKNDQKRGQDAGQSDQSDSPSQQNDGDQKDAKSDQGRDNQKPSSEQPGKSNSAKDKPKDGQDPSEGADDSDSQPAGEKKQTDDSKNAKKGKADGTEKGTAKPDRDPNSKPERAKNDNVKRDPNEKPELRPDSDTSDSDKQSEPSADEVDPNSKEQKSQPKQRKKGSDKNSSDSQQDKKPGKSDQSKPQEKDDVGEKPSGPGDSASEKAKEDAGSESDQSGDGQGEKSDSSQKNGESGDQKPDSNKSQKGQSSKPKDGADGKDSKQKQGGDQSQDKGQQQDQQKGDGQQKSQKQSKESQQTGQKNGEKQSDAKGGKQSDKQSDKGGDQSGSKGDEGQPEKPGADGASGKPGENATKSDGQGKPTGSGGTNAKQGDGAEGAGEGSDSPQGDDPNLEYNRQATELILDKLQKDLDRGDVDPELLEQLGWTEKQLKQFADRMAKSLNESKRGDDTPESQARQLQFQEMLKNLDLQKAGSQRSGEKEPKRDVQQIESKRTPVPNAYKKAIGRFMKDKARQNQNPVADQPKK